MSKFIHACPGRKAAKVICRQRPTAVFWACFMGCLLAVTDVLGQSASKSTTSRASHESDWVTWDIGRINIPGSFSLENGVYTVRGSGADIWEQADAFRYVFKMQYGDFSCVARVLKVEKTHSAAKGGIMVRESLSSDARYAMVFATPAANAAFEQRTNTAAWSASVPITAQSARAAWICLARRGDVFTAYQSEDGVTWLTMGSTTLNLPRQVYIGLAVTAHNANALCEAQFDRVVLSAIRGKTDSSK